MAFKVGTDLKGGMKQQIVVASQHRDLNKNEY